MQLDSVEPTQYLMTSSLLRDGDLLCDEGDLARLFNEVPFASGVRLSLTSDDGWSTARYAEPIVYPLLAAPLVALAGANGAIALNVLCFLLVSYLAWTRLRRWNTDGAALLYSLGFLVFSSAFAYLFRMQPQMLIMAAVAVALGMAWDDDETTERPRWRVVISGLSLAIAIVQEPILASLALPLLFRLRRRRRDIAAWIVGCVMTLVILVMFSNGLLGAPGIGRVGSNEVRATATFTVDSPLEIPWLAPESSGESSTTVSPRRHFSDIVEDSGFLLWGQRSGLLPYFPLILPILALFFTATRRSPAQWTLLATACALGAAQVLFEPVAQSHHVHQIGNPHAVGIYPIFLYLLTRVPLGMITASYALGALVLSTLLLTPFGAVVPHAPVQGHTRNAPFSWLPFEYPTLGEAPDFRRLESHNLNLVGDSPGRLWAPADQAKIVGDELLLLGGESVEAWLESRIEIPSAVFSLRNLAPHNNVSINFAGAKTERRFDDVPAAGVTLQVQLDPDSPSKIRHDAHGATYYYRLRLTTRIGEKPRWRRNVASADYVGVALALLGTREFLDQDFYAVEWLACSAPPIVETGEEFLAIARLRNSSQHRWPHLGAARVRLSYRWLNVADEDILEPGVRTELEASVEPGEEISSWLNVRAPREPGPYVLEIDPLLENIAWFSHRNATATCRLEVNVSESAQQPPN